MCLSPVYKKGRFSDRSADMFVPCGYCSECVRRKKLDWQIRLDAANNWADCSFFRLLTYDPEHYNFDIYDKGIIRDHIQRFLKRFRRRLEYHFGNIRLKYFIASEYGETYDRLHYHCCFFIKGAKFTWLEMAHIIRSCWPYGIVGNTYNLTAKNIAYCVKYIQKQYNVKFFSRYPISEVAPHLEREIRTEQCYSVYDYESLPSYSLRGKHVALPYYWLKKLLHPTEYYQYKARLQEHSDTIGLEHYKRENARRLAQQSYFDYQNSVGFKVPEHHFEKNYDIEPNLNYYESNF